MPGVRIVTDSSCDLHPDEAEKLGIEIVPLTIRIGSKEYVDRVDLSPEDFYAKMAASDSLPETAAPAPGAFEQAFTKLADEGADAVVCVNISSDLSATMQSAQNAARALEGQVDVRVVDSKSITGGLGTQARLAARAGEAGQSADEVVTLLEDLRGRTRVFGALDTLDNLKKGGRIGGAQAFLGSMLSIKPIVDISTGVVEEAAKQRTRKKSLLWLRDKLRADKATEVSVLHANAPDLEEFLDMLEPDFPRAELHIGMIGPVIGTHGGAGIMGICYLVP